MSYTLLIDPLFNDFRINNGDIVLVKGEDAVVQQIRTTLRTQLGEWFLNINFGLPYYSLNPTDINDNANPGILGGNLSAAEIQSYLTAATLQVEGVLSLDEFLIEETASTRNVVVFMKVTIDAFPFNGIGTQKEVSINLGD